MSLFCTLKLKGFFIALHFKKLWVFFKAKSEILVCLDDVKEDHNFIITPPGETHITFRDEYIHISVCVCTMLHVHIYAHYVFPPHPHTEKYILYNNKSSLCVVLELRPC